MTDYTSIYEQGGAQALPDSFWSELQTAIDDPSTPSYSSQGVPTNPAAQQTVLNAANAGLININPVTWQPTSVNQPDQGQQFSPNPQSGPYQPPAIIAPIPQTTYILDASPITEDDPDDPDEDFLPDLGTGITINIFSKDAEQQSPFGDLFNFDFGNIFGEGFTFENLFSGLFGDGNLPDLNLSFENIFGDLGLDFQFEGLFSGLGQGIATGLFGTDVGNNVGQILGLPQDIFNWRQQAHDDLFDNLDNAPWNWNNPLF